MSEGRRVERTRFVLLVACITLVGVPAEALEPAHVLGSGAEGSRTVKVYLPEKPDGRHVYMLAYREDPSVGRVSRVAESSEVERMVAQGCAVAVCEIPPRAAPPQYNFSLHEHLWRGVQDHLGKQTTGARRRLVFLPPGHVLADPIPFFEHRGEQLFLDVTRPRDTANALTLVRIESGTFGGGLVFYLQELGMACVQIPDPFHALGLRTSDEAGAYAQAAAAALRKHAGALGIGGSLALIGKSKHGFAAGVMGAASTHVDTPADQRYQVVLAMTDTYDPATRAEDFRAAGHKVDGNPGEDDQRGSPVALVRPGAPVFYLCDAHGRRSAQVDRMIQALEKAGVSYRQGWFADRPNYLSKKPDVLAAWLSEVVGCGQKAGP